MSSLTFVSGDNIMVLLMVLGIIMEGNSNILCLYSNLTVYINIVLPFLLSLVA